MTPNLLKILKEIVIAYLLRARYSQSGRINGVAPSVKVAIDNGLGKLARAFILAEMEFILSEQNRDSLHIGD